MRQKNCVRQWTRDNCKIENNKQLNEYQNNVFNDNQRIQHTFFENSNLFYFKNLFAYNYI